MSGHPGLAARFWVCAAVSPFTGFPEAPPARLWRHIIAAADSGMLLPRLWSEIRAAGLEVPGQAAELMAAVSELNAQRNDALAAQTRDAIALLNAAGVEPIVLKGAQLLLSGAPAGASRMMNDIDIWTPDPEDQDRAIAALTGAGYYPSSPLSEFRKTDLHHFPGFFRDDLPARIELHHCVIRPGLPALIDEARTAARSGPMDLEGGLRARQVDPMDALAIAYMQSTHMAAPDFDTGCVAMMKWLDVADRLHAMDIGPVTSRQDCGVTGPNTAMDDQFLTAMQALFGLTYAGRTDTAHLELRERLIRRGASRMLIKQVARDLRQLHRAFSLDTLRRTGTIIQWRLRQLRRPSGL